MRKRLLFSLMAMCMAVSGFALTNGDWVYTPQGRFQITGENLNANNAFQDLTGWTLISASEEKTLADQFNINGNGLSEGMNSVQSLDATAGEGMYFKFEPTSAGESYVVSYKIKGAVATSIRVKTSDVSTNLVKIEGNSDNTFGGENDVYVCNTAEELTDDWQTFNYAIVGDGTSRTYYISFSGLAANIEIADLQIAPAMQFADLRQRDAMLEKVNVYKNCYAWSEDLLDEFAINEAIQSLEAIGDDSGQAALDEAIATTQEILDEFLNTNMDDYLSGRSDRDNYIDTWRAKWQKVSTIGDWTCLPAGRGFWESADQDGADMGHFQNSATWGNGAPTDPMGVYMQKVLDPGSYVFSIQSKAALREPLKNSWANDDGLKPAYGVAYITKIVEGAEPDTIMSVVKELEPVAYKTFFVSVKIEEAGTYEIGLKAYCKESHQSLTQGSVTYVKSASIWGKNENKYNQKQLGYEADVREQITTGRTQLTTAAENLANADFAWGKNELKACVDTVETKIAGYEAMDQDAIIATYESDYVKSTAEETGYMVYEVYQAAVKDIIAANKRFAAVNDTLASMQTAIDAAEAIKKMRLYDSATGKDALTAAINTAKGVQTQMKAGEYSEENAATIVAANAALAEAVEAFKNSIPADAIGVLADIDFSNLAVENVIEVEGAPVSQWIIAGAVNSMILPNYTEDASGTNFGQGFFVNGERTLADTLRVGNGEGVVNIPADQQVSGTNILKVDFDFYFGKYTKHNAGFTLQSDTATIAEFAFNAYDGNADVNTFVGLSYSSTYIPGVGASNAANDAIAAASNKTHFEVILDYGTSQMYCTTTSAGGTQTSESIEFEGAKVSKFTVKSNYDNSDRRCWFDNLKIQRINAGTVGIQEVKNADTQVVAPTKVIRNGRIVINGKYGVNGMIIK